MVEVYAGLDVSDKMTHVCVVDGSGAVQWTGVCATDPGKRDTRTLPPVIASPGTPAHRSGEVGTRATSTTYSYCGLTPVGETGNSGSARPQ